MALQVSDLIIVAFLSSIGAGFGQELSKALIERIKRHYKKFNENNNNAKPKADYV